MDRNVNVGNRQLGALLSLSARRAWIEMTLSVSQYTPFLVALRKESVDRNMSKMVVDWIILLSLSARRAWIEIKVLRVMVLVLSCRSPQGERG